MAVNTKRKLAQASPQQIAQELKQEGGKLIPNPLEVAQAIKRPHYQQAQNRRVYATRKRG